MSYIKLAIAAAILLAMLGLFGGLQYFRAEAAQEEGKRKLAEAALVEAQVANMAAQIAIERITQVRANDDAVLTQLSEAIAGLQSHTEEVRTSIAALERGNDEVRAYLSSTLPADLRRLLNTNGDANSQTGNSSGVSPRRAVDGLPKPVSR